MFPSTVLPGVGAISQVDKITLADIRPTTPLFKLLSLAPGQDPSWQDRLSQIVAGRIYLPSPAQFNDPFDCLPPVDVPATLDDWNERKEAFYDRLHQSAEEFSRDEVAQTVDAIIDQHGIEFLNDVTTGSFANGAAKMGVFCLTENVRSVLMWSHYANHHRGIAIRFSFIDDLYDERMTLFRVRYQEDRAILPAFFGGDDQADAIMAALCTKAEFWRYEKEWRFLEPEGAGKIIEIDPRIISGVVLGAKTSHSDACWIADLCAARNIPLMKVRPDDKTFALNFHEARDPRTAGNVTSSQR